MAAARSAFRSSSFRSAAAKIAPKPKSSPSPSPSPFRFPKPIAPPRILRSPVESVCCVESLMPMHSMTAAARLTSMLSVTRGGYGWLADDWRCPFCLALGFEPHIRRTRRYYLMVRFWKLAMMTYEAY